jgi:hypothetical protein
MTKTTSAASAFINIGERTNVGSMHAAFRLSPRGRGREAMTYGRVRVASRVLNAEGADVSHTAELVRGDVFLHMKAPSSGPSCRARVFDTTGHLLPKGRRAARIRGSEFSNR